MPTGYTADVAKGKIEFNDFVLNCAKAFGALISMRNESTNAKIPVELLVDQYYYDSVNDSTKILNSWLVLTDKEKLKYVEKEYDEKIKQNYSYSKEQKIQYENYCAMLDKVNKWSPPSEDHTKLKEFMIEQLENSIKFDCYGIHDKPPTKTPNWNTLIKSKTEALKGSRDYSKKSLEKEIENIKTKNLWISQLRSSLT